MARIRMIKPEFFDDTTIGSLSPMARLLFVGLWVHADREGRLEADWMRIKARIFPYDSSVDIEALSRELTRLAVIKTYSAGGKHGYVWIVNFAKHQRPHPKEPASVIPPYDGSAVEKHGSPCKETAKPSDSGSLDSGVLSLESGSLESGSLDTIEHEPKVQASRAARSSASADASFERFWSAYPKKRGKDNALKAWRKRKPSADLLAEMLAAIDEQKQSPDWLRDGGQYIPHPATWLNGGRWQDVTSDALVVGLSETARYNKAASVEAMRILRGDR